MKIPFQDTRSGTGRRWNDVNNLKKIRFSDIYQAIDTCNNLTMSELQELHLKLEKELVSHNSLTN